MTTIDTNDTTKVAMEEIFVVKRTYSGAGTWIESQGRLYVMEDYPD